MGGIDGTSRNFARHPAGGRARVHALGGSRADRRAAGSAPNPDAAYWELNRLRLRGRVVNWSVGLLVVCAMLIGTTVMTLFLGETLIPHSERLVPWSFLAGISSFVLALMCFLAETLLATHALRFAESPARK
jgi:hypothetical protein